MEYIALLLENLRKLSRNTIHNLSKNNLIFIVFDASSDNEDVLIIKTISKLEKIKPNSTDQTDKNN